MNPFKETEFSREMTPEENNARYYRNIAIGARFYKQAIVPTILYAILFGVLLYDNFVSMTFVFYSITTVIYSIYIIHIAEQKFKVGNLFYMLVLLLLGISTMLTGNHVVQIMNYFAFLLILVSMLIHQFYNDKNWGLGKYIGAVFFTIFGSASCWGRPFSEGAAYRRGQKNIHATEGAKPKMSGNIVKGLLASVPFVIVLGACLSSADAVFGNMLKNIGFDFKIGNLIGRLIFIFTSFILTYGGVRFILLEKYNDAANPVKKSNSLTAMAFITVLDIMYVIFAIIQITFLFMGGALPEGMTYAEYARTGFFQLLFVSFVNLLIVLFIKAYAEKNGILNVLLLIFNICTFITIGSSAYRMKLYIDVYYLTFLRIFVLVALLVIALLFVGVTFYIFFDKFPMFKYGLVCITIVYLVFAFAKVDYIIADYNLARVDIKVGNETGADHVTDRRLEDETDYYAWLSTDAAPAIEKYKERMGEAGEIMITKFKNNHAGEFKRDDIWHYNKSVHDAKSLFGE